MLTEKYRPHKIEDFAGLWGIKLKLETWLRHPQEDVFYFYGKSGTGKTAMALALGEALRAQVIHIASQLCNIGALADLRAECSHYPLFGNWRLILIDEADSMTEAAKLGFLSLLDSTERPAKTIFVFTSNEEKLKDSEFETRFLSRTKPIKFSTYGLNGDATALLRRIWQVEANGAPEPDFKRLLNDNHQNIRACLQALEMMILEV